MFLLNAKATIQRGKKRLINSRNANDLVVWLETDGVYCMLDDSKVKLATVVNGDALVFTDDPNVVITKALKYTLDLQYNVVQAVLRSPLHLVAVHSLYYVAFDGTQNWIARTKPAECTLVWVPVVVDMVDGIIQYRCALEVDNALYLRANTRVFHDEWRICEPRDLALEILHRLLNETSNELRYLDDETAQSIQNIMIYPTMLNRVIVRIDSAVQPNYVAFVVNRGGVAVGTNNKTLDVEGYLRNTRDNTNPTMVNLGSLEFCHSTGLVTYTPGDKAIVPSDIGRLHPDLTITYRGKKTTVSPKSKNCDTIEVMTTAGVPLQVTIMVEDNGEYTLHTRNPYSAEEQYNVIGVLKPVPNSSTLLYSPSGYMDLFVHELTLILGREVRRESNKVVRSISAVSATYSQCWSIDVRKGDDLYSQLSVKLAERTINYRFVGTTLREFVITLLTLPTIIMIQDETGCWNGIGCDDYKTIEDSLAKLPKDIVEKDISVSWVAGLTISIKYNLGRKVTRIKSVDQEDGDPSLTYEVESPSQQFIDIRRVLE